MEQVEEVVPLAIRYSISKLYIQDIKDTFLNVTQLYMIYSELSTIHASLYIQHHQNFPTISQRAFFEWK